MLELNYVRGDTSPQERLRLIETTTGLAQDLTDKTVTIEMRRLGEVAVFATVATTLTDAGSGKLTVTWPAAVFSQAGKLRGDVVITGTGSTQTARDLLALNVRDRP